MRLAFKEGGLYRGGLRAAAMALTRGAWPGRRIPAESDALEPRVQGGGASLAPDGVRTFTKEDAVYRSGNTTRDDIPSHLIVGDVVPPDVAEFYAHMCPAGVYGSDGEQLVVNAPNCIDCKATDVLGPRWTPREGGSGPGYKRM
jgi:ferredoxin-like protein FixX